MSANMETSPNPPVAQQRTGSASVVKWLLIIGIVLVLIIGTCVVSVIYFGNMLLGAVNQPLEDVTQELGQDVRVTERLGQPLEVGSLWDGHPINVQIENNEAEVSYSVVGPQGAASVEGLAEYAAGKWSAKDLTVTFADGSTIKVPPDGP